MKAVFYYSINDPLLMRDSPRTIKDVVNAEYTAAAMVESDTFSAVILVVYDLPDTRALILDLMKNPDLTLKLVMGKRSFLFDHCTLTRQQMTHDDLHEITISYNKAYKKRITS